MNKIKKIGSVVLITLVILILLCNCGSKEKNGLIAEKGYTYYYVNDKMQTGWQEINGDWYYFFEKGTQIESDEYPKGSMVKNQEVEIYGDIYFFDKNGKKLTGIQRGIDGTLIAYTEQGGSRRKWGGVFMREHSNDIYYSDDTGRLITGWAEVGDQITGYTANSSKWVFFKEDDGAMAKSQWIDNTYYVDESGHMLVNTQKEILGKKFIFDSNGVGKVAPYYSAPAMMGSMYNFYLKDNLPKKIYPGAGGDQYGYWIIEDNISLKVVGQTLYINGIIESQIRDRSAHSLGCRLSLTDKNGVTTTIGDRIYPDVVDKGQRTYIEFKVPGLPIIGGDIYIDFYH